MQMINNFGETLKELKSISSMKSITLATYLGYDISYISKWCANKKLPSGRNVIRITEELSRIFSREIINNSGKLQLFNNKYKVKVENIEELNECIKTMLEDSYDRSKRNENISKKDERRIIFGKNDIIAFIKNRISKIVESNIEELDMYITLDLLNMITAYKDKEFYSYNFPKINIKVGCDMKKQAQNNFNRITEMHYLLSMLTQCDVEVYDDKEFNKSNLFLIKNEFAMLFSLDNNGEVDFGVVITNNDDLDKIYTTIKNKFDLSNVFVNSIKNKEIDEKRFIFNFYNSDKFDFLFNVNFDYLNPQLLLKNIDCVNLVNKELDNLQEIIEKKLRYSTINIYIVKEMLNEYIYSKLIHSGSEEIKELFNRIELILKYMKVNEDVKVYFLDTTKFDSDTLKYSLGIYSSEQFVLLKKPMGGKVDSSSFYMIKNSNMIKFLDATYVELMDRGVVREISAEEFSNTLSRYKKLV